MVSRSLNLGSYQHCAKIGTDWWSTARLIKARLVRCQLLIQTTEKKLDAQLLSTVLILANEILVSCKKDPFPISEASTAYRINALGGL